MNTAKVIVLTAALGAIATWLWATRGTSPRSESPAQKQSADAGPQVTAPLDETRPAQHATPPPSGASISRETTPNSRNDSTYLGMLADVQSDRLRDQLTPRMTKMHERFVLTADDSEWGRPTERALRAFFNAHSANGGLDVTSISCRSEGCEVQAEVRPLPEYFETRSDEDLSEPTFLTPQGTPTAEDPRAAIREEQPVGQTLKLENCVGARVGDRLGFICSYKRVRP